MKPLRYSVTMFCAVFMLAVARVHATDRLTPSDYAIRKSPITLAAANVGDFRGPNRSWYLSVNSAGQAQLTIGRSNFNTSSRTFTITSKQLEELRNVLIRERFFDLEEYYGEAVASGSSRFLSVTLAEFTITIQLDYLMNPIFADEAHRLRDPARALRVWMVIRGWFSDATAVDTRTYDKAILDAVAKAEEKTKERTEAKSDNERSKERKSGHRGHRRNKKWGWGKRR